MKPLSSQFPPVKYSVTRLGASTIQGALVPGGLDQTTPSLSLQPGALRACQNFECAQSGGYSRVAGYERFDGHPSPSDAAFTIVQFSTLGYTPAVGDSVTQATSGASGTVIAVGTNYLALTKVSGSFDTSHVVSDGANAIGTPVTRTVSIDAKTTAQYSALAADVYRADIAAVPGSGKILGVVSMVFSGADHVYAFRANAGATAVDVYKAAPGSNGWTKVNLYNVVEFTGGNTAAAADGDVLTQGAVTATVKRVMWRSGSWSGTAAGGFVITAPSGGNFTAGAATLSGSGATVTLAGAQTAIALATGGRFELVKANFTGASSTRRIYGCDGVNKAFEFDGDVLAPITTGNSPDAPKHIAFHKNYLFVTQGSALTFSAPGAPFKWTTTDGGGQIATGEDITGVVTLPGSQSTATLAVFMKSNTAFLYGTDPTTFNYVAFNTGSGALDYTVQNLFDTFVLDSLGVITLKTTLNWGNFEPTKLTHNILPFIIQERTKVTASCLERNKGQYRLFFNDGFGLWLTVINQNYLGAGVVFFPNPVNVIDHDMDSSGDFVTYFGSTDTNGYVYQAEIGTSFDGEDITAYVTLAWDALKSPEILKRFRAASLEMQGSGYAAVDFGYQLGYASSDINQPSSMSVASGFTPAPNWDAFTWDAFTWDGSTLAPSRVSLGGTAENIQVTIGSGTNYIAPYTVNSLVYHFSQRRGLRV